MQTKYFTSLLQPLCGQRFVAQQCSTTSSWWCLAWGSLLLGRGWGYQVCGHCCPRPCTLQFLSRRCSQCLASLPLSSHLFCPVGAKTAQEHIETQVGNCKTVLSVYGFILWSLFKWEFLMLKFQTEGLRRWPEIWVRICWVISECCEHKYMFQFQKCNVYQLYNNAQPASFCRIRLPASTDLSNKWSKVIAKLKNKCFWSISSQDKP